MKQKHTDFTKGTWKISNAFPYGGKKRTSMGLKVEYKLSMVNDWKHIFQLAQNTAITNICRE